MTTGKIESAVERFTDEIAEARAILPDPKGSAGSGPSDPNDSVGGDLSKIERLLIAARWRRE